MLDLGSLVMDTFANSKFTYICGMLFHMSVI